MIKILFLCKFFAFVVMFGALRGWGCSLALRAMNGHPPHSPTNASRADLWWLLWGVAVHGGQGAIEEEDLWKFLWG